MAVTTSPPTTKVKVCKRKVHNGVERVKCENIYQTVDCPKQHVLKFKTGFCGNGQCEGTKPKGNKGKPLPTCKFWQTCACECHARLDEMFKSTGMPRVLIENAEYIPEKVDFDIMDYLTPEVDAAPFSDDDTDAAAALEGMPVPPPVAALAQRRTETGRAARGGLEAQVLDACHALAILDDHMTPKMISAWIAGKYSIPEPSTGAIGAVFNRWEKLGFAKQERKPVRFAGFTGEGTALELERIKGKTKREKKLSQSAIRRGFR